MFENVRKRIALAITPARKEAAGPFQVISSQTAGTPIYTDMTVRKATREGYKISIYVYRAVRTIVQAASAIPWVVKDLDGELIERHPFTRVWERPNPEFSGQDNMEFLIAHLLLAGNALIQPLMVNGKPKEFWMVMPDLVRPIPSDIPGEWLKGWEVQTIGGAIKTMPADQFIHFMQMDPGNPYWGIGPLMAAAKTIDTDNEAQDTQKVSMQNRGVTDGVFAHEAPLTAEQFEEARRQIRENYLAKGRRREPWVLGAGAKWIPMSLTPMEMDFIKSRLSNLRAIAAAFGLDPWWLGDRSASTYNNVLEARKALYVEVVIPMLDDIKATLNLRIAPMYGDIVIAYDTSKVAALREDYTKKVEQAKTLWAMGVPFDQINDRLEMGFAEFSGWDRGYLPLTLLPTGASRPTQEEESSANIGQLLTKTLNLDNEEQKTAHWKRIDRRRVAWWGVVAKRIEPLYRAEGKELDDLFKGKKPNELIKIATFAIRSRRPGWEMVLTATLAALVEDFGNEIAEDLGAEKSRKPSEAKWTFDPFSVAIRKWIATEATKDIVSILATNLEDVKIIIAAGIEDGIGSTAIGRNLRQFYIDRSPFKAMRVARTEVTKAASFGSHEAAKLSGIVKTKSWLTSRDDRVRDAHIAMEGESVKLDENFSNGLKYPSEIMCRCVLTYHT